MYRIMENLENESKMKYKKKNILKNRRKNRKRVKKIRDIGKLTIQ